MKKRMKIIAAAIVLVLLAGVVIAISGGSDMGILGRLLGRESVQTSDLAEYVSGITGVQLDDICIGEEGEVTVSSSEEYACIRLSLGEGAGDLLRERLAAAGQEPYQGSFKIPGYNGHELAGRLKAEELECVYMLFASGKSSAKTRSMELYLTADEEGHEHLYLFG